MKHLSILLIGFGLILSCLAAKSQIFGPTNSVPIEPTSTYLLSYNDDLAVDATSISLSALGIHPGDRIKLQEFGTYSYDSTHPSLVANSMIGVFSSSGTILPSNNLHRIPGAIAAGNPVTTLNTYYGSYSTDIPEDFYITTNMTIRVPDGAAYLFVCPDDSFYTDNDYVPNDPYGLKISLIITAGIDVSHLQETIDWNAVAAAGVSFVFVKATQGTSFDTNFVTNIQGAGNAHLLVAPYHFAGKGRSAPYVLQDPITEAQWFLSHAGRYIGNGYLPPALDLEGSYIGFTGTQLSQWARAWVNYVQQRTGIVPIIYANKSTLYTLASDLQAYPLWIATDSGNPIETPSYLGTTWPNWQFNQYRFGETGGTCPGITSAKGVDLDSFNGSSNTLHTLTIHPNPPQVYTYISGPDGDSIQPPQNGQFQFQVSTDPSLQQVVVQASSNLASWTDVVTLILSDGTALFTDTNVVNNSAMFYRVKP